MDKTIENLLLNEEEIKNKKIVLKSYPKRLIAPSIGCFPGGTAA